MGYVPTGGSGAYAGGTEKTNVVSTSGAAQTIADPATATVNDLTLTANCTLTFPSAPSSGETVSFTLILRQDTTGSRTITWPASIFWAQGTAPTLSTTASAVDVLSFTYDTVRSGWFGFVGGLAMS